jgi:hypothetical protein
MGYCYTYTTEDTLRFVTIDFHKLQQRLYKFLSDRQPKMALRSVASRALPSLFHRATAPATATAFLKPAFNATRSFHATSRAAHEFARVQHPAPAFTGDAVVNKEFKTISLSDYQGKWLVLFFYPLDFTFV